MLKLLQWVMLFILAGLTDAVKAYPEWRFDWVVEERFAEIPRWHPAVERVIPSAWRRCGKSFFLATFKSGELQ